MSTELDPIDAADSLCSYFEEHSDVAYAEVGAISRRQGKVGLTADRTRRTDPIDTTGVWCRAYVDGSASYRFITTLDEEHMMDIADRVIRSARVLGQDRPSQYDPATLHRATHGGWGDGEPFDLDSAHDRLRDAQPRFDSVDHENARLTYQRTRLEHALLTTTGSTIHTTLDRGSVVVSATPTRGSRLQTHIGTTTGPGVLDRVESTVAGHVETLERLATLPTASEVPTGRQEVVLGPRAAGQLFHHLAHYFEMDTRYMGATSFDRGDRIAPEGVSIHDTVRPGSWAAIAYDMEGRPAHATTLLDDGIATEYLHSVETAIEEGTEPRGNVAAPVGFEHPPRIHARHLDVDPGSESGDELADGAAIVIDRLKHPKVKNEVTNAKRTAGMPASTLYALDVQQHTPDELDEDEQTLRFAVGEGYVLDGSDRSTVIVDGSVEIALDDLQTISGLSAGRETITGTCSKHRASIPYAVTAPAVRLTTTVDTRR